MNHNLQMSESEEKGPPWPINVELQTLHGIVIHYSIKVQEAATRLEADRPHVSYHALANLHMRAIIIHRSIRDLCEAGWTPVTGILIRTLLDIYVNCLAIAIVPEDSEFMAFRFLLAFPLSRVNDSTLSKEIRQAHREEIEVAISRLPSKDTARATALITDTTRKSYWYQPEFSNPSDLLRRTIGDMPFLYRTFSSSTHGGVVGLALLDDEPDTPNINPKRHPRKTPISIVASSRLLLEITFLRDQIEGTQENVGYYFIKDEVLLPLKGNAWEEPDTEPPADATAQK
jgi:hypothetical protein